MKPTHTRYSSEQGVVLVFTAIAILVLMGFMVFVVDNGIRWVGRAQAQNAADAGALSGAVARGFDDLDATPVLAAGGKAYDAAKMAAEGNMVWNAAPVAQVSWTCPTGVVGSCVRVDVFRGAPDRNGVMQGTPLPLFFGPVLNITTHGVRATATAITGSGNATNCMRPFAVADRWADFNPADAVNPAGEFHRWDRQNGNVVELMNRDQYVRPTQGSPGTGLEATGPNNAIGAQVTMRTGQHVTPGWSLPIRLPDGAGGYVSGANDYSDAIKQCIGNPVAIGDYLPLENGVMQGPTTQGVQSDGANSQGGPSLMNQDPNASWDSVTNTVVNSCAPSCGPYSPRIVPIAVIDMDEYQWRDAANNWGTPWIPSGDGAVGQPGAGSFSCPANANKCVRVVNIIGFFVEGIFGGDVRGRVVMAPGLFTTGAPSLGTSSSFLTVIKLIR